MPYQQRIGTRRQVWNGTALQTSSGKKKKDFRINKRRRIVSKAKSDLATQNWKNKTSPLYLHLELCNALPVKGEFNLAPKGSCAGPKPRRKRRTKSTKRTKRTKTTTRRKRISTNMSCSEAGRVLAACKK